MSRPVSDAEARAYDEALHFDAQLLDVLDEARALGGESAVDRVLEAECYWWREDALRAEATRILHAEEVAAAFAERELVSDYDAALREGAA